MLYTFSDTISHLWIYQESKLRPFLIERGVFVTGSRQRAKLLGCVACIWTHSVEANESPEFTSGQISQCTNVSLSTIEEFSRHLLRAGFVDVRTEPFGGLGRSKTSGSPSNLYVPVDNTPEGRAFQDVLDVP